ncbi:hypothetical protein V6N13_002025 [Hibiscus sabdariffa]
METEAKDLDFRQESDDDIEEDPDEEEYYEYNNSSENEEKENRVKDVENSRRITTVWNDNGENMKGMVTLMEMVAEMKKAYIRLQEMMRAADVAMVGELRKLGVLRET